jgi:predicted Zn-dependent protease
MGVWDWQVIEKQATAALAKKPDDFNSSRRQAQAVGMQGNVNQAISMLEKHLSFQPKDARAMDMLAAFQLIAGRAEDALATCDNALKADANAKYVRYNRAIACIRAGKAEEGIRDLGVAVEANAEFRDIAAEDPDFAPVATNPRFKAAIAPPPPKKDK